MFSVKGFAMKESPRKKGGFQTGKREFEDGYHGEGIEGTVRGKGDKSEERLRIVRWGIRDSGKVSDRGRRIRTLAGLEGCRMSGGFGGVFL